ncbi:MAG: MgtC/SapB family protein [Bacilli bacterium]|nr:MgtC/SapB family protein [Bacilli bacterium]MDD4077740.1 MgtC/SapB family protein [Bacilli bacterium]MDD4388067.1 MgtC/SapB family protein [Bacilli bacterium]
MTLLLEQILRVIAAAIVGAAIGYEREIKNKPAGFFTFTLVCIGSCLIAILQQNIVNEALRMAEYYAENSPSVINAITADQGRIIAAVVSGIGFLGAGAIIHNRFQVRGVTTAAMLWLVSGVGLLIGTGGLNNYVIAGVTVVIILPITMLSRRLGEKLTKTKKVQRIMIVFEEQYEKQLFDNLASQGVIVRKSFLVNKSIQQNKQLKESIIYFSLPKTRNFSDVMDQVSKLEYVYEIQEA